MRLLIDTFYTPCNCLAPFKIQCSALCILLPQGAGSGFVWDEAGRIVTNYHVIKGAQDLLVTMRLTTNPTDGYKAQACHAVLHCLPAEYI